MRETVSEVRLEIGSRFENIELVQVVMESSLRQLNLGEEISHAISLAVREAVANAIKHGNEEDPAKKVEVGLQLEGEEVVIRVRDQGPGFDPKGIPDPRDPENLLRPNGRGLFFMQKFMDDLNYDFHPGEGTVLTLRKRITAAATEESQRQEEN